MEHVISTHDTTISASSETTTKLTRVLLACGVVAGPLYTIVGLFHSKDRTTIVFDNAQRRTLSGQPHNVAPEAIAPVLEEGELKRLKLVSS